MRFVCDSCHAQYMISDEKVGATGVRVRCKKCGNIITVKKTVEAAAEAAVSQSTSIPEKTQIERDATEVMMNPLASMQTDMSGMPPSDPITRVAPPPTNPFAAGELDDEIGHAFDSVLGGDSRPMSMPEPGTQTDPGTMPIAAAGASAPAGGNLLQEGEDPDRLATRVMDLAQYASLTKAGASDLVSAASKGNGTTDSNASDWYVAIADQQVGPLAVDGIRDRWNKGELSADSLVWRPGFADWRPLSSVIELANVLAPVPKSKPAGATASGAQLPWEQTAAASNGADGGQAAAAAGTESGNGEEPEWKPSAASAMQALVEEEIKALTKPTPKRSKEHEGVGEEKSAAKKASGLLDLPEVSNPDMTHPGRPPSDSVRPVSQQRDQREDSSGGMSVPVSEVIARPKASRPRVAGPEPSQPWKRDKSSRTLIIAIVGSALGVAGIISLVLVLTLGKNNAAPASAPAPAPTQAPAPTATAPVTPTPAPTVAAPTPSAPAPTEASPTPSSPEASTQKTAAPPKTGEVKTPPPPRTARLPRPPKPETGEVGAEPPPPKAVKPPVAAKHPEESEPPPPKKSKTDSDFDEIFNTGGSSSSKKEAPEEEEATSPRKKKGGYVPPPPGAPAKASLGPSDITQVVVSHLAEVKACLTKMPGEHGSITMEWTIKGDGKTSGVTCKSDDFKGSVLDKCLSSAIHGWQFPTFSGPPQTVPFPFKF